MAIECASCFCSISRHDDQIECSSCDKKFHISCKGVTVKLLTDMKLQATIKQWSCGCARAGGAAAAIDGGAANAREFPDFKHQLKELGEALHGSFSGLLRVAVNELLKENASLREDIRTCQQQNASLTASLESGIGSLREGMVELRADNARLRDELAACRGAPADEQTAKQDNGDHFRGRTSAMTTKSARGRNNNKQITADELNNYFVNACHDILGGLAQPNSRGSGVVSLVPKPQQKTGYFRLCGVSQSGVRDVIGGLRCSGTVDVYGVSVSVVKSMVDVLISPLTRLVNECISRSVFPACLQVARVAPIFKAGDRSLPENYRPVSVLPVFSKILERVIYNQVSSYLEGAGLLVAN